MPALNLPNDPRLASIPVIQSRVPNPEELVVLSKPLLDATIAAGELLADCSAKWAIGGDLGEILFGVNVQPDHVTILTTANGCDEINKKLAAVRVEAPRTIERRLNRNAEIQPKPQPITIKAYTSQFAIKGQKLEVHGDLQIRVGEWEWGDPIDYDPEYVYVVGVKVPVVPLGLKKDLYFGLGWLDRVKKINEAVARAHHKIV